jgi:D-alanyl-D-alanine carboxypeptidase/D-alanyl-D-alanine-endopeptidase (penicillin-binding protein 4)
MRLTHKTLLSVFILVFSLFAHAEKSDSLQKVINKYRFNESEFSFGIVNLADDQVIGIHNEKKLFNSASLVKIITTYIGLKELGPDFSWRSDFYYTGDIVGETLKGDIVFKGTGDASFSVEDLEGMIREIQGKGIKRIEGNLLFDTSYFGLIPNEVTFDSNPMRAYNVVPSAISLQSNTINFRFTSHKNKVKIVAKPNIKYLKIINNIKSTREKCLSWREKLNYETKINEQQSTLNFSGKFSRKCKVKELDLAMLDWQTYFYHTFKQKWLDNGGWFNGNFIDTSGTLADDRLLVSHYSEPLSSLIRDTNKYSLNLMSRNLILTVIANKNNVQPTEEMVNPYIKNWLSKNKIDNEGLFIDNGAGLSRDIKISINQFLMILQNIYYDPMMPEIISSFPIAGIDGTLKKRMKNSPIRMNGHFKTGSMNEVSAMAGFFLNNDKEMNIFVFMMNGKKANMSQNFQEALIESVY